jgi:hypothetical protein
MERGNKMNVKRQVLASLDTRGIAVKYVYEYYGTAGGMLCVWDDGTASMLYHSFPSDRCVFSIRNADSGYEIPSEDIDSDIEYYIDCLEAELDRMKDNEKYYQEEV